MFTNVFASPSTFTPFYGSTTFSNSEKKEAKNYGVYYKGENFKTVVEKQAIKYNNDSNSSNFTQTNYSVQYNIDIENDIDVYTTLNYIQSSNTKYSGIYSVLLGSKKKFDSFTFGLNLSYSDYNNVSVKSVKQISPYIGFSFGDYNSLMGNFYTKIIYDTISLDSNLLGLKKDYSTYSVSLTHSKRNFQNFVGYWFKDHLFALRDDGLTIQNFEEIYENALSISSKYNFSPFTSLQISFIQKDFHVIGQQTKSKLKNTMLFLYSKF